MNIKPSVFSKSSASNVIEHISEPIKTNKISNFKPSVFSKKTIIDPPKFDTKISIEAETTIDKKKAGRPSKKEEMTKKIASISDGIRILVGSEPSKADIREYFRKRLSQLKSED